MTELDEVSSNVRLITDRNPEVAVKPCPLQNMPQSYAATSTSSSMPQRPALNGRLSSGNEVSRTKILLLGLRRFVLFVFINSSRGSPVNLKEPERRPSNKCCF